MGIYLDYNASAPINEEVLNYMIDVYKTSYGNADSRTHEFGEGARRVVEDARGSVAKLLACDKMEVFFTSGATESNNIAIQGLVEYANNHNKKHIITTSIEHKSILESAKHLQELGFDVEYVKPDYSGQVCVDEITNLVREDTLLVSVMHANNETGIIQPVFEIGNYLNEKDVLFHVDATQSCGKLVDELRAVKYDMLSLSAHKFGGPQGVGALVLKKNRYKLPPVKNVLYGGQQEHGIRPGTIPVALVAGLGKACEIIEYKYKEYNEKCMQIKRIILKMFEESKLSYSINGNQDFCLNNTLNICIDGISSEALMISTKQYCGISNGSACNSNSYNLSYVLVAMGIEPSKIENSIRISWGAETDIDVLIENLNNMISIAKGLVW